MLGKGFILEPEEAQAWIAEDPRNAEVLFPYLNGEDLNSRPDCSPSRWVIDFNERSKAGSSQYRRPWNRVLEAVKPERATEDAVKYPRMVNEWWKYYNSRPAMREAIAGLDEVFAIAQVSRTLMPARLPNTGVFDAKLIVFALNSYSSQAVLSSSVHQIWAIKYGTTMRTDPTYTPTTVFETFPRPESTPELDAIGRTLDTERREIMLRRQLGLTKLYNLVNDPELAPGQDPDVDRMRAIHVELDAAVTAAYGWDDLDLTHGFHEYRKMTRWTIPPATRVEVLDRLLEENHHRAAAEKAAKKSPGPAPGPVKGRSGKRGGRRPANPAEPAKPADGQEEIFHA